MKRTGKALQTLKEKYSIATNKNPKRAVLTLILVMNFMLVFGGAVMRHRPKTIDPSYWAISVRTRT